MIWRLISAALVLLLSSTAFCGTHELVEKYCWLNINPSARFTQIGNKTKLQWIDEQSSKRVILSFSEDVLATIVEGRAEGHQPWVLVVMHDGPVSYVHGKNQNKQAYRMICHRCECYRIAE